MVAALLFMITLLGVPLAVLVRRADPKRWDNRVFSLMVLCDAMTAAARGALCLLGQSLEDIDCLRTAGIGNVVIAYLSVEFAYSFPFDRRLPRGLRVAAFSATLTTLALLLHPATFPWFSQRVSYLYFLPFCIATLVLLYRNYRELRGRSDLAGIPVILVAVALRWAVSMFTYLVARNIGPSVFAASVLFESTGAVFLTYILFCQPILRHHLFHMRGVAAEIFLTSGFVLSTLALLWLGIDLALAHASEAALRPALVAVALVPAGLFMLGSWLRPRVADAILAELDPRRAQAKKVMSRVVRAAERGLDAETVLAMTVEAIAEITLSSRVRFLRGPAPWPGAEPTAERLGPATVAHLLRVESMFLHRPTAHDLPEDCRAELAELPEDLFVFTRRAGELFGVFAVEGGTYERDVVMTCVTLSEHLALKIENQRLFSRMLALQGELEESHRLASLGSFAAAIAHDIRTPLTSIQMNVQILRGKANLPADDMEYFDIALEELKHLNASISEILDFAKPVKIEPAPVGLASIADDAVSRMRPILAERALSLETDYDDALPPALVDAPRIRQVLINLLENAAHASDRGAKIVVGTRAAGDRLELSVSDNGRGIKSEHLPKIFEPFFTTRADGTGLGLATAQKLVRAHGGEIRVESTEGRGARFTVVVSPALAA